MLRIIGIGILVNGVQGTVLSLLLAKEILISFVELSPSNISSGISSRLLEFSSRCFSLLSIEKVPFFHRSDAVVVYP